MVNVKILGENRVLKILRAPRYKKPYTISLPPPWSKLRDYLRGLRPAQESVVKEFTRLAHGTAKKSLADRMYIIGKVMRGRSFGGKKRVVYPRMTAEELERLVAELSR